MVGGSPHEELIKGSQHSKVIYIAPLQAGRMPPENWKEWDFSTWKVKDKSLNMTSSQRSNFRGVGGEETTLWC